MHAKSDSEVTSLAPSSPPRSPRRPIYFVMSPSDAEKMSLAGGSTPGGSPVHRYSSPIYHSRESSTARFSSFLKSGYWHNKTAHLPVSSTPGGGGDDDDDDEPDDPRGPVFYAALFVVGFVVLFSFFSLVIWCASRSYVPAVTVEGVVFKAYNVFAGMDQTGVPTKFLSLNSTVKMWFKNTGTFFGVHVSSSPLELYFYDLLVASGNMKEFYQSRKSGRIVTTVVGGTQVPLYGAGAGLTSRAEAGRPAVTPLKLTFRVRARANVLGKLVHSKFYCNIACNVHLREDKLGKVTRVKNACSYHGC